MKLILNFIFLFVSISVYSNDRVDEITDQFIQDSLHQYDLVLDTILTSKVAKHYTYHQEIEGLKIYGSQFKINISLEGKIISKSRRLYDNDLVYPLVKTHNVIYADDGLLYPALVTRLRSNGFEVDIIEYNGEIVEYPLYSMLKQADTIISVMVYEPDPLSTAGVSYGGTYTDQNDSNVGVLNNERVQRFVKASIYNGNYLLANEFVRLMDLSDPGYTVTVRQDSIFHYTRNESGFEECNVLYHITEIREYVDSLGFDVMNYQLAVDAHGLGGADNSMFVSSTNPPRLIFGEGGVDDAEDVDVIMHEFGHAYVESCAPFSNDGSERRAVDEAIGDYFAASYSRRFTTHDWEKVFSWDGHNEFWNGRMVVTDDHYPQDLQSNYYENADIWSAAMMALNIQLGEDLVNEILIQSMFTYHVDMTMFEAAKYFVQADSLLNNGANYISIINELAPRGLMDWDTTNGVEDIMLDLRVRQNAQFFYVETNDQISFSCEVYDLSGRLINRSENQRDEYKLSKKVNSLQVLYVQTEKGRRAFIVPPQGNL